ncbi:sensor histidine kinase [Cohnella mopanensis]|uniref:sensor histidine kinase n=1 Tax=Cohnella mopanensis TaxID=2911966 RepID=UPI001EF9A9EA|nr:HAMP domain-containing sensor histidine kinase [Cohnella mopanensis]
MERIADPKLEVARLWRNPSIRRLSLSIAILAIAVVIFIALYSYFSADKLKQDWLDKEAAMLGSLAQDHPELATDWLKQLSQADEPSPEAIAEGRRIMERYGMTPSAMETSWLPVLGNYRFRTFWILIGAATTFIALLTWLLFRVIRRQLGEIRSLAVAMEDTVKHNRPMAYRMYDEGELGLLANSAQELTIRLRETIEQLHRDKAFLKDTVADISHQLKTPLASLMIYIDLLQAGQADAEHAAEFLRTCKRELDRMEWLTLTLLKLARLEADALQMSLRDTNLAETIQHAVHLISPLAVSKKVTLRIEDSDRGLIVPHDSHWLAEALANLFKNAVEHSPIGGTVSISWENTPVFVRVQVKDQGNGIDPRHLPHIFKKFYRNSSEGSGVGLGLPLAKSIVEKHGGVLSAAVNPIGGMMFHLSLPQHPFPVPSGELTEL